MFSNHIVFLSALLCGLCLSLTPIRAQQLNDWSTSTGKCEAEQLRVLKKKSGNAGFTFSTEQADIYAESGLRPAGTGERIPPMTALQCHARGDGNKILVSNEDKEVCGWVDEGKLLHSKVQRKEDDGIFGSGGEEVCPSVSPLRVRDFCKINRQLG